MFGDKKNAVIKADKKNPHHGAVTIITSGCHFNGKLHCRGSSRIAGEIEGEIISEGLLVIEESAVVNGTIKAEEVVIHGKVEGSVTSTGRVALAPNCYFTGEISSPSLVIAEGAQFNGTTIMTGQDKRASLVLNPAGDISKVS